MTKHPNNMNFLEVKDNKLQLSQTSIPTCKSNQCLVRVAAIGLNRADLLQKEGKYPPPAGESPILGLEVAGEIVEIAENSAGFKIGDRVCGLVAGGGYAQYAAINVEHLIKLPDSFSYQQGAATAEVFLTAYQSLFTIGGIKAGDKVLIHAGASGVGTAAIQLAKALGCFVVTTIGSERKAKACKDLGADVAINYHRDNFVDWSKAYLKQGFDVILDVVAGRYVNQNIQVSAVDAHIVILAMLGGRFAENVDIAKMLQKRLQVSASTLRNRSDEYKAKLVHDFTKTFMPAMQNNEIKPVIDNVYSWLDADVAHQFMATNQNIGKLILTVDD